MIRCSTPSIAHKPLANKPGELHRIIIMAIEIGLPKTRIACTVQSQFQINQIVEMIE